MAPYRKHIIYVLADHQGNDNWHKNLRPLSIKTIRKRVRLQIESQGRTFRDDTFNSALSKGMDDGIFVEIRNSYLYVVNNRAYDPQSNTKYYRDMGLSGNQLWSMQIDYDDSFSVLEDISDDKTSDVDE